MLIVIVILEKNNSLSHYILPNTINLKRIGQTDEKSTESNR